MLLLTLLGVTPLLTMTPAIAAGRLDCTNNSIYALGDKGQLQKFSPGANPAVSTIGTAASGVSQFNGLGIGEGGSSVYAYERSTNGRGSALTKALIYTYDPGSERWTNTGDSYDASLQGLDANLVAGAVNLKTGSFLFGGFTNNGKKFQLYEYQPQTKRFSYLGFVATKATGSNASQNGDLAFDTQGNMFVVRGVGSSSEIYAVKALTLAAADGGELAASVTNDVATATSMNGVAFDSDGRGYLGQTSELQRFEMPNWTDRTTVTNKLSSSWDLASCASPPTITVQKDVAARASTSDQFRLGLFSGRTPSSTTEVANTTTAGTATGLQDKQIGPFPATRGATMSFNETAAGSTELSRYASKYECLIDGKPMSPAVTGSTTGGSFTVPQSGQSIVCTLTNTPKASSLQADKTWMVDGTPYAHGKQPDGLSATLGVAPTGNKTGPPSWGEERGGYTAGDTVKLSETTSISDSKLPGCTLTDSTVAGTGISGSPSLPASGRSVTLQEGKNSYQVTNTVACQTLTLTKQVANTHGGTRAAESWNGHLFAKAGTADRLAFDSGLKRYVATGTYALSEDQFNGYDLESITCTGGTYNADAKTITLTTGQSASCTLKNVDKPGSVTWKKIDVAGNALKGSVWSLKGPGSATVKVEDCIEAAATACTGSDKDPAAGAFRVVDLTWGDYTLTESKAPAGYQLNSTPHPFTIRADALAIDLGRYTNNQAPTVALPLTGGNGSLPYFVLGASLVGAAAAAGLVLRVRRRRS
ncbi:SpaA isopeptide-forming pilin-related protein [Brevibacterium sp. BRM-1]|uniref:SpaA isopeptide-forming pilin-related protein n=1 Tax=Brevibacterium sp. BRM-1 TaxID=2999062 RepID=UPI002280B376|nr:SpaA isopeptide-forming pilin-related protein [Brevibacterium sp. BRM-1]WAL41067.1 SpaA isopeptide-forming pilin-related protein [Brevibacterium sp. BRM-1]